MADQGKTEAERQPTESPDQPTDEKPRQADQPGRPQDDETRDPETTQTEQAGSHREQPPGSPSTVEQMLNRLKDQPGRAMMPNYRKRAVEKDW